MKRVLALLCAAAIVCATLVGCSSSSTANNAASTAKIDLADGTYTVEFKTDSTMFHANESCEGKVTMVVKDGVATAHVPLASKGITNLFLGTAEDAAKDGAKLLQPVEETVKYSDGYTQKVYAYDIPVPVVNKEFDCAIIGEKGKWYDHKVSFQNPVLVK